MIYSTPDDIIKDWNTTISFLKEVMVDELPLNDKMTSGEFIGLFIWAEREDEGHLQLIKIEDHSNLLWNGPREVVC